MKDRISSFKNAFRGIRIVIRTERNMQIHLIVAFLVIIFSIILHISLLEFILCIFCFGLVISAEMINSAIEKVVDLASPQHHKLAGHAKDIAAGAVLVSAICAACVGIGIFLPKIIRLFA